MSLYHRGMRYLWVTVLVACGGSGAGNVSSPPPGSDGGTLDGQAIASPDMTSQGDDAITSAADTSAPVDAGAADRTPTVDTGGPRDTGAPATIGTSCSSNDRWACLGERQMFPWDCLDLTCTSRLAMTVMCETFAGLSCIQVNGDNRYRAKLAMPCLNQSSCVLVAKAFCSRVTGTCVMPLEAACEDGFECESGSCRAGICAGAKPAGQGCTKDVECASGTCTSQLTCR